MNNLIDFVRKVHAAQNFILKDDFTFIAFEDISKEHIEETQDVPETLEIWAAVKIPFEGELPESYKVLNLMIGDWVESNLEKLTPIIHEELKGHFKEHYPESDISGLEQAEDTAIWLDQLDYMPRINEDEGFMLIEVELVLETEAEEEGE